jgi:hypothetical protein
VGDFASAEPHGDLQPVSVTEELLTVFQLHVEIVLPDAGRHPYLFYLYNVLVAASLFIALRLFESVLAVVHNLADGRIAARRDFYEVELALHGDLHRVGGRHNAELLAVLPNKADLFVTDFIVDLIGRIVDVRTPPELLKPLTLPGAAGDMRGSMPRAAKK